MYTRNLAKMSTPTTGTGDITLASAGAGFLSFADAGVSDGNIVTYVIENGTQREVGRGTYSSGVLTRSSILNSTNSGSALNLSGSSTVSITAASVDLPLSVGGNDFRISLVSGNPVPSSDVTAATTVYLTPYKGNVISLYDNGWRGVQSDEVSLSLSGLSADTNYDVFAYLNSGAVALEATAWTNGSTRATAIVRQDGVYVKSGDATRRYIGTIRTTSTAGQCEDSFINRFIDNHYNRDHKILKKNTDSGSHTYSSTTVRPFDNSTSERFSLVCGQEISMSIYTSANGSGSSSNYFGIGYGINSVSAYTKYGLNFGTCHLGSTGFETMPVGYSYIQLLQNANGTYTFNGGGTDFLRGLYAEVLM